MTEKEKIYDWILDVRKQCVEAQVSFHFKQTGAVFRKNGRLYRIQRKDQMEQARKSGIDYLAERQNIDLQGETFL